MAMTKDEISAFRATLAGTPFETLEDAQIEILAMKAQAHVANNKSAQAAIRKQAKEDAAKRKQNNAKAVADLCDELGVEIPGIVKSIHRTDKVVKDKDTGVEKIPQVLTGLKLQIGTISFSLDAYVATGKGAKLTPEVEEKVKEAQALCMNLAVALADAGYAKVEEKSDDNSDEE